MLKCWEADVENRLCFKEIVSELTEEISNICANERIAKEEYTQLNIKY